MVFLFFFFPLPFASPNRRCRGKLHKSIMKNCFSTNVAVCLRRDNQQQAKDVEAFFRFAWQSRHFVAAQLLREITLWRSHSRKFNAKNNSRLSSLRPTRKKNRNHSKTCTVERLNWFFVRGGKTCFHDSSDFSRAQKLFLPILFLYLAVKWNGKGFESFIAQCEGESWESQKRLKEAAGNNPVGNFVGDCFLFDFFWRFSVRTYLFQFRIWAETLCSARLCIRIKAVYVCQQVNCTMPWHVCFFTSFGWSVIKNVNSNFDSISTPPHLQFHQRRTHWISLNFS